MAGYLPTTEGTVNGRINFNLYGTDDYIGTIVAINDSNGKRLFLDTYEKGDQGAFLELRKGSDTKAPGRFQLAARNANGSTIKPLVGYVDGSLTWDGKQIVRSVNGVNADTSGNVDINTFSPPNYNAAYVVSPSGTATEKGYIRVFFMGYDGVYTLNIGGVPMFTGMGIGEHWGWSGVFPVDAGESWIASGSGLDVIFIPLK